MPKLPEPEVSENGIKIYLDPLYWIQFTREWSNLDVRRFRKIQDDLLALRAVIEKVVDWNLPDARWEPLPFRRDEMLHQIDAFLQGTNEEDMAAILLAIDPERMRELNNYAAEHGDLKKQLEGVLTAVMRSSAIVEKSKALIGESSDDCFSIPAQLQGKVIAAYITAYQQACRLPFGNGSRSMPLPSDSREESSAKSSDASVPLRKN